MKQIQDCLNGKVSTEHILPFLWVHGESHADLLEEIDAIQKCNINEFCVESRTYEKFCQEEWWEDFGFILAEAKKRGMRVWLLDDKHFPTGYANNYIVDHPELKKVSLRYEHRDFVGPQQDVAILTPSLDEDESFVAITAFKREVDGNLMRDEFIDLLPALKSGVIRWDIPEGVWRVCYVIRTRRRFDARKEFYIDVMSKESCQAMIDVIYQPHYDHFAEYFGNTFVGFFSDEPGFANESGSYYSKLGKPGMLIPWNDEMPAQMAEYSDLTADEVRNGLCCLWHEVEGKTAKIREPYMECATKNYSENLCWMLGNWCRAHNVLYIGHVIEDMNTHQRLGYGAGHYFRSLDGQDMAGIDIVLQQMIPGHNELDHSAPISGQTADPAFFRYTLPKLGASHSHIQPLKKGRAMCEIFGAFGWAEGVPMMKHMADLMLVSGINYFVPHAFTPKYPDRDCPPHFYAKGHNVQMGMFGKLMQYMARVSQVMYGGVHQPQVAVYYNAEAEWSGGKNMLQQEVCKYLTQHQIDFDIIPQDTVHAASVEDGKLRVNLETYQALIVPYSQYLPQSLLDIFETLAGKGLQIIFVEDYPDGGALQNCTTVALESLAEKLPRGISLEKESPYLRFYHIKRDGGDIVMLWNEDIFNEYDSYITFPCKGDAIFYDAWKNQAFVPQIKGDAIRIKLAPGEALILGFDANIQGCKPFDYRDEKLKPLSLEWTISACKAGEQEFVPLAETKAVNLIDLLPGFTGRIRYETVVSVENPASCRVLELSAVGETAELFVNGLNCGAVVAKPYRFEIEGKMKKGENRIVLEVCNNLGYANCDRFSTYLTLPPIGLIGELYLG